MAKKDKKKSRKDAPAEAVGAVRTAVERTFLATAGGALSTRERAQDLVDEVATAASRVRGKLEDFNVVEDLKGLHAEVDALKRRVAELERSGTAAPRKAAASGAKRKPAATRSTRSASSKPSTARQRPATKKGS